MVRANHNHLRSVGIRWVYAAIGVLSITSGLIYLFNFKLYKLVSDIAHKTNLHVYVPLFLLLGGLYLAGVFLVLRYKSLIGKSKGLLGIILFFAVVFRLCLVPLDPEVLSKDMYRFVWDGRVQHSGINPYRYPPAAEELETLRDERIYPNINRKDYPTLYPAGAQILFRISYALVGDSVIGFKSLLVFFDLLTLLVLTALLKVYRYETNRLIIYAWNPLVIIEISYSGHIDGIVVFFMMAALYLNALRQKNLAVIMLALSSAIKLYPALLLAAILNRGERIKGLITFSLTFVLLYLPYMSAGNRISGFLPIYLKNRYESFNLGLKTLIMYLFPGLNYYFLSQMFILTLAVAGTFFFFRNKLGVMAIRAAYILTGLLILLMPASLHPWYVILIIPFLVFYPNIGWLIFGCTVTLSYLKYVSNQGIMPTWVLLAEYLPLLVLITAGAVFQKTAVRGAELRSSAQPQT